MPEEFVLLRFDAWQRDFTPVKDDFAQGFAELLNDQESADLEFVAALRNAIGHSHVSIARGFFLYKPRSKAEAKVMTSLDVQAREGAREPKVIKLAFYDDAFYLECFERIQRLDAALGRVAESLGVSHGQFGD